MMNTVHDSELAMATWYDTNVFDYVQALRLSEYEKFRQQRQSCWR